MKLNTLTHIQGYKRLGPFVLQCGSDQSKTWTPAEPDEGEDGVKMSCADYQAVMGLLRELRDTPGILGVEHHNRVRAILGES
jgi:hypothetical protein